jgi:hypothetical protein
MYLVWSQVTRARWRGRLLAKFAIFYRDARESYDSASVPVHLSLDRMGRKGQPCAVLVRNKMTTCQGRRKGGQPSGKLE